MSCPDHGPGYEGAHGLGCAHDDEGCVTTPDGGCVGEGCMHDAELQNLLQRLDGFLGLIVYRRDTDREQAIELLNRVQRYTRRRT